VTLVVVLIVVSMEYCMKVESDVVVMLMVVSMEYCIKVESDVGGGADSCIHIVLHEGGE
jgi:hypothetical protein